MRRFPAGVAILSFAVDGRDFGLTVGSLVSLSLEPALVGVSIGIDSSTHEPLREADGFALSLLGGDQASLAQHFARSVPPLVMWDGVSARHGSRGRLLDGAAAWLDCRTWSSHDVGDHTFFVGAVERIELGRDGTGLVYRGGGYHPA